MGNDSPSDTPIGPGEFASTHWSIVLAAGHRSSPDSREALAALCRGYWFPLYAYARRRTRDVHEAQDLTQEFFATLLEKDYLATSTARGNRDLADSVDRTEFSR